MGQYGQMIAESGNLVLRYAEQLMAGVTPDNYARFAQGIASNHPGFILGHLALYPVRMVDFLGGDTAGITPTDAEQAVFKPGVDCQDDPEGSIYPSLETVQGQFFDRYRLAIELVGAADDARLAETNPLEGPIRERFPTAGGMFGFFLGGHAMMHLGQWSAWRRAQGLGPAN